MTSRDHSHDLDDDTATSDPRASGTEDARSDRRGFLKLGVGLGLGVPVATRYGVGKAFAQEATPPADGHGAMTDDTYVGSDASTEGTGAETPAPATEVQPFTPYDPVLPAVEAGTKDVVITAKDATLYIAKDVAYAGWTFDGTIPGRIIRAVEGDTINLTVRNEGAMAHSVDTHAAKTAPDRSYANVDPGGEFSWSFVAKVPGAFLYHCGTAPVLMHIGAGMYGAMIVDPKEGWPPARELVFVQSDFYLREDENPVKLPDYVKMLGTGQMDYVVFNGYSNQYVENPIPIRVGEMVRIFVINAGPNVWSSFHVVGGIFDRVCVNGNPKNQLFGLQSVTVGPGDGTCVEFTVEEPGTYVAVNHAFGHAAHGAIALLHATT
jgi:nitrite reductase (NO-forming)